MRPKSRILIATALVGAVVGVLIYAFLPREPRYEGKPISVWIRQLADADPLADRGGKYDPTKESLRALRTNSLPILVQTLNQKEPALGKPYAWMWQKLPKMLQVHFRPPWSAQLVKREAAQMIGEMVQQRAQNSFNELVPPLEKLLHDPDPNMPSAGISLLGALARRTNAIAARAALVRALDSLNAGLRSASAYGLSECVNGPKEAVPRLQQLSSDPDVSVRINAAIAVFKIDGTVNEPVRVLTEALQAQNPTDRGNAAYHLWQIGPPAIAAVPSLIPLSRETNIYYNGWPQRALQKIDPEHFKTEKQSIEALTEELRDPERQIFAAYALKTLGAEARQAVPTLRKLLKTSQPDIEAIADALLEIAPEHGAEIIPAMLASIRRTGGVNRHLAPIQLAKLGPAAKEAIPVLVKALDDLNPLIRQAAGYALLKIDTRRDSLTQPALAVMIEALQPKYESSCRLSAARNLGELGEIARPAIPVLIEALNDGDEALKKEAAAALMRISPKPTTEAGVSREP